MNNTDTAQLRYSHVAIIFHWLIALAIIANWVLAIYAEDLPKAEYERLMGVHVAIGLSVLILSLLRVAWRLMHKVPPPNPDHKPWERLLSSLVHKLFYVLIVALPLTGYLIIQTFTGGMDIPMFGLFDFPGLAMTKSESTSEAFGEAHEVMAWLMAVLLLLHVVGAWKHQLLDRDGTIGRMLPFGR